MVLNYYTTALKKSGLECIFNDIKIDNKTNSNNQLNNVPCTTIMVERSLYAQNDITKPTIHFSNEILIMYIKSRVNK